MLERTTGALEPMLNRLVFIGGRVTEFLIMDPAAVKRRAVFSADVIPAAVSYSANDRVSAELARLGFRRDLREGAPLFRWLASDDMVVDVLPSSSTESGFGNQWYEYVLDCTLAVRLRQRTIRVAGAPAFLALKLAAFAASDATDPYQSRNLEEILTVVLGRPAVEDEIASAPPDARQFIAGQLALIANRADADSLLEGLVPDARRFPRLAIDSLARIRRLASL